MKEKTLYMIGNAHIDPVWLWQWQDGFTRSKAPSAPPWTG